jgi:large subunit ribosomal protein L22
MNNSSKVKYLRISSSKLNKYLPKIRKKSYRDSLKIITKFPYKIKRILWKALNSAASNAVNNFKKEKDTLQIVSVYSNHAGILKRFRARARGKSFKIEKKLSHLFLLIT